MIRLLQRGAAAAALLCASVTGCAKQGLSVRETPTRNISTYLMTLSEQPAGAIGAPEAQPRPLRLPIRAAVAQVGEVAPVGDVLTKLYAYPGVFARAQAI